MPRRGGGGAAAVHQHAHAALAVQRDGRLDVVDAREAELLDWRVQRSVGRKRAGVLVHHVCHGLHAVRVQLRAGWPTNHSGTAPNRTPEEDRAVLVQEMRRRMRDEQEEGTILMRRTGCTVRHWQEEEEKEDDKVLDGSNQGTATGRRK